jgi:carboxylesterase type B
MRAILALGFLCLTFANASPYKPPRVDTKNGTLEGTYLPKFNEDVFLGIPFAAPPIGDWRLRRPVSYQKSWNGIRDATRRGTSCPGYGPLDAGLTFGEGMLTMEE